MTPINDDTTTILPSLDDDETVATLDGERSDDLADELARAAPKQWWNKGTVVLGAIVLVVGGFVGGLQAQKHWGTAATGAAGAGFNQNRAAAGYGGGQNRGGYGGFTGGGGRGSGQNGTPGGAAAPAAAGTVKLVDGSTIYVQTTDGNVLTVKTDGSTTVTATSRTTLKTIKAGDTVTVQGAAASDGTVTATSVTAQHK